MTIDEAIEMYKKIANTGSNCPRYCMNPCEECVKECKQIAEWLEELKAFRENKWTDIYIKRGYDKAIDDFVANVKDALITDYSVFNTDDIRIFIDIIEEIAEQLKAGGNNGIDNQ